MTKIRILPDQVANQITAGEVIERPAAVVKELIENSLDAGATRIQVEFRNGGKTYIRVEDNGSGMSTEEALLSLERHSTSKLTGVEDLLSIGTFGFRGEAVPSIASVSQFTLRTRRAEDIMGTEIQIQAGKILQQKDCGMAPGTRIEVEHLFNSVATRRAFLKTENTEAAHIIHLCKLYAVSFANVAFEVIENGNIAFRSPKCLKIKERVGEIWGWHLANELIEFEPIEDGDLKLYGAIGRPPVSRSTKLEIVTIINKRPVESKTLNGAIIESYHTYIPKGRYPIAFLFLEMNPAGVDVNVHPAKREVRFREEGRIRHFIIQSISQLLQNYTNDRLKELVKPAIVEAQRNTTVEMKGEPSERVEEKENRKKNLPQPMITPGNTGMERRDVGVEQAKERIILQEPKSGAQAVLEKEQECSIVKDRCEPKQKEHLFSGGNQPTYYFLTSLPKGYFLFKMPTGLVILNPKAALKRIRYEEIKKSFEVEEKKGSFTQTLLMPIQLQLNTILDNTLRECFEFLKNQGFQIELFGRNFYRVETIPCWLEPENTEAFIRDFLEAFREQPFSPTKVNLLHELLAKIACRDRFDIKVDSTEMAASMLMERLLQCDQPMNCPQGRPTLVEWSYRDLDQAF